MPRRASRDGDARRPRERVAAGRIRGRPARRSTPTPDDGTRLTGILPWDEATRPTYPVRPDPAEQRRTSRPSGRAQHLIDVHDHLRAELTQLRDVVEQVRQRARSTVGRGALGTSTR